MSCLMDAWSRHEAELRAWLRSRLGNVHDAEDLLQEIFIKALRHERRFCELDNARAWLFEVTRNALADRLRVARTLVELPDDLVSETHETAAIDNLAQCLPRALAELAPVDREAITLCDLEGMSQADFARRTGLTLPAAKSRVQRARKKLHLHLMTACRVALDADGRVCCFVPRGQPR